MRKCILTIGLGFGDEGKGSTVDLLCRLHKADLVVRYSGGAQAGHNVQLPNGHRHTFSQFGAGTFAGAATFLGPAVIIRPQGIQYEAEALKEGGIPRPLDLLTVHPDCLVATPYHQAMNRIRELQRGCRRHGSCGQGIGETRSYWLRYGLDAITAGDTTSKTMLKYKLSLLRQRLWNEVQELDVGVDVLREFDLDFYQWSAASVAVSLRASMAGVEMSWVPYETPGQVIFEASQGVLLDETFGFHPHTTWSTVTTHHAEELCQTGFDEIQRLGITRAYTSRHGQGPLPTYSKELTEHARDPGNPKNDWQGAMRLGWLDMKLLKYGVEHCGSKLDGIVVNHLDQLPERSFICRSYDPHTPELLHGGRSLRHQEHLGDRLKYARPVLEEVNEDLILSEIGKLAPIYAVSHGPTHEDRKLVAQ